jgi:hypothetical protein
VGAPWFEEAEVGVGFGLSCCEDEVRMGSIYTYVVEGRGS